MSSSPSARPPASTASAVLSYRRTLERLGFMGPSEELASASPTRARTLEAAIPLFAAHGFDACTMRDLANAVGVKAPALYNHFASKEQILAEAMHYALASFYGEVLGPLESEPPEAWLEGIVRRHVGYQLRHREFARANDTLMDAETIRRLLSEESHGLLVRAQRAYVAILRDLVADASPQDAEVDPAVAAFGIVAMCDATGGWYREDGDLSADDVAAQVWTVVSRGLRTD